MKNYLSSVDKMTGLEFEEFTVQLLKKTGYLNVETTKSSSGQGADVVAEKDNVKFAVLYKQSSSPLGNTPVQVVNDGKLSYNCHVGVVLTNNYFTEDAKELAKKTQVMLWDRDKLSQMIEKANIDFEIKPDKNAESNEETEPLVDSCRILQNIDKNERGWECILFSEVFDAGIKNSADLKRKYNDNIPNAESIQHFDTSIESLKWLSTKTTEITEIFASLDIIGVEYVEAMGPLGTPGNADKIIIVAEKLIRMYRNLWKWGIDFNSFTVNQDTQKLILEYRRSSLTAIADMEKLNEDMKEQVRKIKTGESDSFNVTFVLKADNAIVMEELNKVEKLYYQRTIERLTKLVQVQQRTIEGLLEKIEKYIVK